MPETESNVVRFPVERVAPALERGDWAWLERGRRAHVVLGPAHRSSGAWWVHTACSRFGKLRASEVPDGAPLCRACERKGWLPPGLERRRREAVAFVRDAYGLTDQT